MSDDFARPYVDTRNGKTVMLTDRQFSELAPGHPYRRIRPGEVVPPAEAVAETELHRMDDDGAVMTYPEEQR